MRWGALWHKLKDACKHACESGAAKLRAFFRRNHVVKGVYALIIASAVFSLMRIFIAEITPVDGPSMESTLFSGEQILVDRISYYLRKPARGEIVICRYPGDRRAYVKRIVALEGESVEVRAGLIHVNGVRLDESAYWNGVISKGMDRLTVPEGHIFVVGDNRNRSVDSRDPRIGPIPMGSVIGKAMAVAWPLFRFHFL